MSNNIYTPQHNGIEGLSEFGDAPGEYGAQSRYIRPAGTVYHDGRPIIGRTTTPTSVAEYFAGGKIELVERAHTAFSYADPRGWRIEFVRGFKTQCPTKWADGALRFSPGWDTKPHIAAHDKLLAGSICSEPGEFGHSGSGITSRTVELPSD